MYYVRYDLGYALCTNVTIKQIPFIITIDTGINWYKEDELACVIKVLGIFIISFYKTFCR